MPIKIHDPENGNAVHLTKTEARAGATPHMTRVILLWSLALVVIAFIVVVGYYMMRS
jgi:hypothetical protein